ncbi:Z1 domain-containing protein [Cupriavidus sp. CV2]|uniref:Z1 domain-containing protein n=1 Tax=Cupriavidus ulmosensis TaxID=3065913 RepID=UPI00296AEE6D|nr:Z1 domain-containing protein [Cupriavidus sp. CV2]MDW3681603.1 Z1 domain-containing protein [Cupriavidus sp. CV2]
MDTVRIVGAVPPSPCWTDRLSAESWYHWGRLEELLRTDPKWEQQQVDSVAAESLRVLRHLQDPMQPTPFQGRGLVVGYVQSGKTANYTAVAARAVDAGYRIVIVLSGIHDSLRNQTQNRLERELTGHQASSLPRAERGREWISLTTPAEDFKDQDERILQSPAPFLAVVKKNVAVLQKLDLWLESAERYLDDMPVLIIDDEADQASINTKGNKPLDPTVGEEDDNDEDLGPSRTNGLIRSILTRAKKAAYIAYTATPFANILINPEAVDRRVGVDLFPKDFVIQLPRPKGYTGTEELFGVSAQGRDVLRTVPEEDVKALRAPRRRKKAEIVIGRNCDTLPNSLADALVSFCLAGGVRTLRGLAGKAHTMLVHVSQRTADQGRIANAIRDQLDLWREAERQGQRLEVVFGPVWENMKAGVDVPANDEAVLHAAMAVLHELVVLELNSVTGEDLEYDEKPGRHIVAVGGNRLSRGLTLEGLTVSYFLRTASMCDTLLQMARWYGFRRGYEDLIRIWTTDGIARWFSELALVEQSLRDSIIALARAGRRPDQMAVRLRAHSDLLLTARNKSGTVLFQQDSWSGEHPQTVLLPLSDPTKLQANLALAEQFIAEVAPSLRCHGGFLARDVAPEAVSAFLRNYQIHDDIVVFRSDLLADWIMGRTAVDELTDWSIFVASPASGRSTNLGGMEVGLVRRKRISSESIGILTDPAHEGVDLPYGPDAYMRDSGAYDAEAMRAARPATQGLLIIYPLDPEYLGIPQTDAVIALALSLPQTSDAGATWIVNSMVSNG